MPRKRTFDEVEVIDPPSTFKEQSLIHKIRNMWEFASVMQYIFMFGKIMKIDEDFDIEDFENECLKPGHSDKLEEIGLQLLRFVSSNRGLNLDNWDEYVRRQYQSKAPDKSHPYGEEDQPNKFRSFDIFTKVRTLHQLSIWTFWNPDRIRGALPDLKESEQLDWRMNVFGWDEEDREYFVLDDSRLYRRTEPAPPPAPKWKPKANSLKARAERRRASKRRRLEEVEADAETYDEEEETPQPGNIEDTIEQHTTNTDTFGGFKWECVAITLEDYQTFVNGLKTSIKNYPNERAMRDRLNEEVMPIIQELADKQRRKQERRERELQMMERMVGAKRSSRLANKQEQERREQEEAEATRKHAAELAAAHRENERQEKMEKERQSRMMTREQRIKDREYKRLLMEEEIARDAEEQKRIEEGEKRGSERHIRDKIEKNKRELEELANDEDWTFDCSGCGVHGKNIDDGSHSIACERCGVWQHSKCLGISKASAEKDDFSFICGDCRKKERQEAKRKEDEARHKEEEANKPKIMLKFKPGHSSSPPHQQAHAAHGGMNSLLSSAQMQSQALNSIAGGHDGIQPSPPHQPVQMQPSQTSGRSFDPSLSYTLPHPQAGQPMYNNAIRPQNRLPAFNSPDSGQQAQQQSPSFAKSSLAAGNMQPHQQSWQAHQHPQQQHIPSSPVQSTPRPVPGQGIHAGRLPSPVLNKPTMSPTQGNPDVGPIAGVPNSSSNNYHPALFTNQTNGTPRPQTNGNTSIAGSQTPVQRTSQTPQPQHLSGLSPVKQRSPLPPPGNIPEKQLSQTISSQPNVSFEPNNSFPSSMSSFSATPSTNAVRNVSGTPIFPPAEKLAPSPEHIDKGPVPTPSKQPTPSPHQSFEQSNSMNYNSAGH